MTSVAALAPIAVFRYRAHLRPRRDLVLDPARRRAVVRGAFALTLRRLVCHDRAPNTSDHQRNLITG